MNQEQQERANILLKAALDILNECNKGSYVKNVMEVTAIWDEAECDGYCLRDEIDEFFNEAESNNIASPQTINFKALRDAFFKEHVAHKTTDGIPKICTHPHNLFEWFKAEINEYIKHKL